MEPAPAIAHKENPLRGIMLVMAAVLMFACMDVAAKHLMMRFNVPYVASVRYALNFILLLALLAPRHGRELWRTRRTGLVLLRGASLAVSSLLAGLALQRMPVGETVAILYLAPFGVMLLAGPLLSERIGVLGWIAAFAGFAGVLLVARPGSGLAPMGLLFAMAGAATSVVYVLLSRLLASTESTMAMLFHTSLAGLILFGIMLPWHWNGPPLTALDTALLLFIGVASLAGHYLFTAAYREAPASLLAPFNYFHIAWAIVLGWLVFRHVPDAVTMAGIGIIAASGALVAARSRIAKSAAQET